MGDVYVIGVDMIKFGRFPEKTVPQLGATAALMAMDDAGLTIHDLKGLYCGNLFQASGMVGQKILREIGQTGIAVVNCANACATGADRLQRGLDVDQGRSIRRGSGCRCRANGKRPARRSQRRLWGFERGSARIRDHACGFCRGGHGTRPKPRNDL